jgi:hypothetical protein
LGQIAIKLKDEKWVDYSLKRSLIPSTKIWNQGCKKEEKYFYLLGNWDIEIGGSI